MNSPRAPATTSLVCTWQISPRLRPHSAARRIMSRSAWLAFRSASRMALSGHGFGCGCGRFTLGNAAAGLSCLMPKSWHHLKNVENVFLYALRVSAALHFARYAISCRVVTSLGATSTVFAKRCSLYQRLLIVCSLTPPALLKSRKSSTGPRHDSGMETVRLLLVMPSPPVISLRAA